MVSSHISIASMNCRGLASFEKRRDVFQYLRSKNYSIYCLQDVHFDAELEGLVRTEWGLECFFSSFKSNSRGVAILLNNNFEFNISNIKTDKMGNMLALDIVTGDYTLTIINLYGPNSDDPGFYDDVFETMCDMENTHTILCGD